MSQQGQSSLGMVVVLLLLGTLMLNTSQQRLARDMMLVADERQYLRDFWAAQSALQWGLSQRWPEEQPQLCQSEPQQHWQVCLQEVRDERALLRGQAENSELSLWQWVVRTDNSLSALPHGWIDFCPQAAGRC